MKWFNKFMYGRYGVDQFNHFLIIVALILTLLSLVFPPMILISYGVLFYSIFRMFSKQFYKRSNENTIYLHKSATIRKFFNRQKNKWKYRHTHKYLKCPYCHQYLRVPKGKGNITITCPSCHKQFDHHT